MVRPDSSDPRRVLDEPPPSDATQSKQRIIHPPLLQHSHISLTPNTDTLAGLEIERILEQVLEQALLATSASAAAIALQSDNENDMVCRAAAGPNAPDVGVRLDVSSGLSGACVRSREVQHCADTETDVRVNAAASRQLQVRSVLVVPLLDADQLLGVFEIFSPHPGAFGNRDLENLETLAKVVVANLRELGMAAAPLPTPVELSPVAAPPPDPLVGWPVSAPTPASDVGNPVQEEAQSSWTTWPQETNASAAVLPGISSSFEAEPTAQMEVPVVPANSSLKGARRKRARDWVTSLLTAGVIAMAVILGWTVGRPRWQRVTSLPKKQTAITAPVSASSGSGEARSIPPATKSADPDTVESADESTRPGVTQPPASRREETVGGLVVYQNGKAIFRQNPRSGSPGRASAKFGTARPDIDTTEKVAAVFLAPQMASGRLLQRIEPVYPESALQLHIQGEVELEALVGKDGSVEQLKLVSGDSQLAAAAADAVRQWRFRPYQSDGKDVEFSTRLTVEFRLH
jgi:TonB family protein